jgi:hypothetical protein
VGTNAAIWIQKYDPASGRVPRAAVRIVLAGYPCAAIFPAGGVRQAHHGWQEESDAAHPLTWVPGRYMNEGELR